MSLIFTKESTTKQFPNLAQEYISPFFIEAGIMPDRKGKGKSKSCQVYINNAGIVFLRPIKLSKAFKVSLFIPINTISELVYDNPKRRTINCAKGRIFFECPHIDKAIECIVASRNTIYPSLPQLIFNGFPQQPIQIQLPTPVENLALLRYVSQCLLNEEEIDSSACQFLATINTKVHQTITFDNNLTLPIKYSSFTKSLNAEKIRSIYLKNFSPYSVCRLVHFAIKNLPNINRIVFDGYSNLIPSQLRMENLKARLPISFAFVNCRLTDKCFTSMIENFSHLNGEIQRFSIENMCLSSDAWNYLFYAFDSFKPWDTMECCDFNGIDLKATPEEVSKSILILQRRCRFIQQLSLSNWVQPIPIAIDSFAHSSSLNQLILQKQDFTEPISETVRLPSNIFYIDVSQSTFTLASLISFLKLVPSIQKKPIILSFADIVMPENSWSSFYSSLSSLTDIRTIKGLDWSGNPIDSSSLASFYQFFFVQNNVCHLKIDRVFNTSQINDFHKLINCIGPNKLFSLSVGGSSTHNFSGSMKQFLDILNSLGNSLMIFHISGQKIINTDSPAIIEFLRNNNHIVDFSMDDTDLTDESQLFDFYENIFMIQNISIIQRPNMDLNRLLGGPNLYSLIDTNRFYNLKNNFHSKGEPMLDSLFAFYLCRYSGAAPSDIQKYIAFYTKLPNIFIPIDYTDDFQLGFILKKQKRISLLTFFVNDSCKNLTELQNKRLVPPEQGPNYRVTKYGILTAVEPTISDENGNFTHRNSSYEDFSSNINSNTNFNANSAINSNVNYNFMSSTISNVNSNNHNSGTESFNNFDSPPINLSIANYSPENNISNNTFNNTASINSFESASSSQQFGGMAGVASSGIQLEPLADTPEMESVLSILSGIFEEEAVIDGSQNVIQQQNYQPQFNQTFGQQQQPQQQYQQQFYQSSRLQQRPLPMQPGAPQTFKKQQIEQPQQRARSSSQNGTQAQQPLLSLQQMQKLRIDTTLSDLQKQQNQQQQIQNRNRSQSQANQQQSQPQSQPLSPNPKLQLQLSQYPQQFKQLPPQPPQLQQQQRLQQQIQQPQIQPLQIQQPQIQPLQIQQPQIQPLQIPQPLQMPQPPQINQPQVSIPSNPIQIPQPPQINQPQVSIPSNPIQIPQPLQMPQPPQINQPQVSIPSNPIQIPQPPQINQPQVSQLQKEPQQRAAQNNEPFRLGVFIPPP